MQEGLRPLGRERGWLAILLVPTFVGLAFGTIGSIIAGWGVTHLPPYSFGYVNVLGFLLIAPVSFFAAPFGAQMAHAMDRRRLRIVFAGFIAITAARMFYDALT